MRPPLLSCLLALSLPSVLPGQMVVPPGILQLDAVEVTAQKRVQAIHEVPVPINAYSGIFLETAGISQFEDLAPLVPGLFVQQQSPNFPGINIRGITTDSSDPRSETRVSIFQDGVSISRATGSTVELFDLERVEVLKGPQGTLFGRGAEVGAISIIQRKPATAREASLSNSFGRFDERRIEGHVNVPFAGDSLLARVAFTRTRRDGTILNLADGSRLHSRDTVAVRPSFSWLPGDNTRVDLIFNYQRDQPSGVSFKSGVIPTSLGDTDPFSPAELNRGEALRVDRTVWGATILATHDLNEAWTLTSITGARRYDSHEEFDADGSRFFLLELSENSVGRQASQEFRANFDNGGRFAGFGGVSYFKERGNQRVTVFTDERQAWPFLSSEFRAGLLNAGLPPALVDTAVPVMHPFIPQTSLPAGFAAFAGVPPLSGLAALAGAPLKGYHEETYFNVGASTTIDAFLDGTYKLSDRFELTAGARVSFEEQTSGYLALPAPVPSTLGFMLGAGPNLAFAPTGRRREDFDDTSVVGRLIGRYLITDQVNAYASISRGRRPASIIIDSTTSTMADEEVIWNYEVGIKGGTPGRRIDYSASVFFYDYSNFQTSVRDPDNAARFITVSAGNATGQGAELTFRARATDSLSVFANYGYTDATFDDRDDDGQPQRYAGSSFRLTARHAFTLGGTLTWNTDHLGRFSITPMYHYKSGHYFDDDNTRFGGSLHQDGFGLVKLRASWLSRAGRWEVSAYVDNLLDEEYLIDAGNFGANYNIPTFVRGEPRLYGISLSARF